MPDLRSPESITKDIKQKEQILANVLNLEKLSFRSDQKDPNTKKTTDQVVKVPLPGNIEKHEKICDKQLPDVFSEGKRPEPEELN